MNHGLLMATVNYPDGSVEAEPSKWECVAGVLTITDDDGTAREYDLEEVAPLVARMEKLWRLSKGVAA